MTFVSRGARKDTPLDGEIELSADIAAHQVSAVQWVLGDVARFGFRPGEGPVNVSCSLPSSSDMGHSAEHQAAGCFLLRLRLRPESPEFSGIVPDVPGIVLHASLPVKLLVTPGSAVGTSSVPKVG